MAPVLVFSAVPKMAPKPQNPDSADTKLNFRVSTIMKDIPKQMEDTNVVIFEPESIPIEL